MNRTVKHLIGTLLLIFCIGFFYLYSYIFLKYIGGTTYIGQYVFVILYYAILIGSSIYSLNNNLKIEFVVQCVFCLTFGNCYFFSLIYGIIYFLETDCDIPEKVYKVVEYLGRPFDMFFSDFAMILAILSAYIPLIILISKIRFWIKEENLLQKNQNQIHK